VTAALSHFRETGEGRGWLRSFLVYLGVRLGAGFATASKNKKKGYHGTLGRLGVF